MSTLKTVIFGIGKIGIDATNNMLFSESDDVNLIVADINFSNLQKSEVKKQNHIKVDLKAEKLVSKNLESIKEIISKSHLGFIISALNNKIDYLLLNQIISLCKKNSSNLIIGIIPIPLPSFFYPFEESLNTLKNEAEFIIFLNNGDFSIPEIRKNKSQESFNCKHFHKNKLIIENRKTYYKIFTCIKNIIEIFSKEGYVCLDFEDIKLLLSGTLIAEVIEISSLDMIFNDAKRMLFDFHLEQINLSDVKVILIIIRFDHSAIDFRLDTIDSLNNLGEHLSENIEIMWKTINDPSMNDKIQITIYILQSPVINCPAL